MKKIMFAFLMMFVLTGCSSTKYMYRQIQKDNDHSNARVFECTQAQLQKALEEMLLSKQFVIDKEDDAQKTVVASRYFSQSRNNVVVVLQARMFSDDESHQKLFINGIQTTQRNYVVDRTRFFLWIVPLPGGGGREVTKTKEAEAAIEDKLFYEDLFNEIQKALKIGFANV